MLLSDQGILVAIKKGDIVVENFDEKFLQPASYDMRLGEQTATKDGPLNIREKGVLRISPGEFVAVTTLEFVKVSNKNAGTIGLKSKFARLGVILLAGPQIDPGFEGILQMGLVNLGPNPVALGYAESFCTVQFFELETEVSHPYSGPFQGLRTIHPDVIRSITTEAVTLDQVLKVLTSLSENVSKLSSEVSKVVSAMNTIKWAVAVFLPLIATIAVAALLRR